MLGDDTERGGLCVRECRGVYGVADMMDIDDAVRVVLNERVMLGRVCHRRVQFLLHLRFGLFLQQFQGILFVAQYSSPLAQLERFISTYKFSYQTQPYQSENPVATRPHIGLTAHYE